ncbi:Protein BUD31 -like protein, partial [Trichinella nativa]
LKLNSLSKMHRIRAKREMVPKDWEVIESTMEDFDRKMREAQSEPHEGKRRVESLWPIFRIHHQRSRYLFEIKKYQRFQNQNWTRQGLLNVFIVGAVVVPDNRLCYSRIVCNYISSHLLIGSSCFWTDGFRNVANGKFDKAGLCPLPPGPTVSNAINYCNQDDDCKDAMKCCPTILGRRCMNPDSKRIICPDGSKAQQTCNADSDCHNNLKCTNGICCPEKKDSNDDGKPGSCPQLIVPSGYAIGKDDECRGDLQCSGKRKCCQTLAGKRCLLPV